MHDVIATLYRGIQHFGDVFLRPTELFADEAPGLIQSEQHACYVNAPLTAEIAEVKAANHFVGNKQGVWVNKNANNLIESESQVLELALDFVIPIGNEAPS